MEPYMRNRGGVALSSNWGCFLFGRTPGKGEFCNDY